MSWDDVAYMRTFINIINTSFNECFSIDRLKKCSKDVVKPWNTTELKKQLRKKE